MDYLATTGTYCVYCGKKIEKRSHEHIIQNAIGGLYESNNICCPECNNYISKYIDAPFTKIFNPIISRIENFTKTNNTKSRPVCKGKALYDGEAYDVLIKSGKVIACPELSKKLKSDISKLSFKILAYDFPIDNRAFINGINKIAFNFALEKGICLDILKKGMNIKVANDKLESIAFDYPVIPFFPLNPLDKYIELNTNIELYHNLILFSQRNMLWCYIDLFNTFQYYILLSDNWDENIPIHKTYLQLLQKIDRSIPDLYIRKLKDIFTLATSFNIDPCMDLNVFKKNVIQAIQKESQMKSMSDVLSKKIGNNYLDPEESERMSMAEKYFCLISLLLYFDEDDHLIDENFRTVTLSKKVFKIESYPLYIRSLMEENAINISTYTSEKLKRLNNFLTNANKTASSMDK